MMQSRELIIECRSARSDRWLGKCLVTCLEITCTRLDRLLYFLTSSVFSALKNVAVTNNAPIETAMVPIEKDECGDSFDATQDPFPLFPPFFPPPI